VKHIATDDYYKDKICIVTGANSGIGYALSEELLKRGATVYMLGRNPEKVAKAAEQLAAHGDRVHTLIVDVTKQEQVQQAIEGTAAEAGRLDMLFNNAGISDIRLFETATFEDWNTVLNANLWSVIYGVHAAIPIMLRQGSGHIVNTASVGGLTPEALQILYNTSKYAVVGLSESLRCEYSGKGLHFSVVCPGVTATPIYAKVGEALPDDAYPADKAAVDILDGVAELRGIIVVPENPYLGIWIAYVIGHRFAVVGEQLAQVLAQADAAQVFAQAEDGLLQNGRTRRTLYETDGHYV
jgi:NAD(P)-dependent dehydrogenase (short-subunit alcohol dehydrogenase family)